MFTGPLGVGMGVLCGLVIDVAINKGVRALGAYCTPPALDRRLRVALGEWE